MKMRIFLAAFAIMALTIGCKSTGSAISQADIDALDAMIENKTFEVRADWAQPLGTTSMNSIAAAGLLPPGSAINRINLQGTSNYFRMQGDKVTANLPYYGEVQMGGTYGRATGVEFDGVPTDLKITKDEKKQSYRVRFNIRNKTETFQVNAELFPNFTSALTVNSSQRFVIRYSGTVAELEKGLASN